MKPPASLSTATSLTMLNGGSYGAWKILEDGLGDSFGRPTDEAFSRQRQRQEACGQRVSHGPDEQEEEEKPHIPVADTYREC